MKKLADDDEYKPMNYSISSGGHTLNFIPEEWQIIIAASRADLMATGSPPPGIVQCPDK
jgi:hypothetical protein